MNWFNIIITCIISIGGFTASTYEVTANRMMLSVGNYFRANGIMTIVGGFVTLGAIVLTAFVNPWWTIFIVFIAGWFFSQLLVKVFKEKSQLISVVFIVIGICLCCWLNKF